MFRLLFNTDYNNTYTNTHNHSNYSNYSNNSNNSNNSSSNNNNNNHNNHNNIRAGLVNLEDAQNPIFSSLNIGPMDLDVSRIHIVPISRFAAHRHASPRLTLVGYGHR